MESNSWSDSSDAKKDVPEKSDSGLGRPSNLVYGPGRSAVFGLSETKPSAEVAPLFAAAAEKSEPETARRIIPAEAVLPSPATENMPPVSFAMEQPPAAQYVAAQEALHAEHKDDDEEDDEDDDDGTPAAPPIAPPRAKTESVPAFADVIEAEIPLRPPRPVPPVAAPAPAPQVPEIIEPVFVAAETPPPRFEPAPPSPEPPRPFRPPTETVPFSWPPAGGNKPPTPPLPPRTPDAFAEPPPEPAEEPVFSERPVAFAPTGGYETPKPSHYDYVTNERFENADRHTRNKLAGLFATTVLAAWWVNRQAKKRDKVLGQQIRAEHHDIHQLQAEQQDFAVRNQAEHQALRRSLETPRSTETMSGGLPPIQQRQEFAPAAPAPVAEQLFGDQTNPNQVDQTFGLQPEEQLKRSAWHSYVEKNGQVVEGAIPYGEEFQRERVQERNPAPFGAQDNQFAGSGAPSSYHQTTQEPLLPSGQVPLNHILPLAQTPADPRHLLPPPEPHPLVATLMSPWLWLSVGVLMIAFFLAATI